MNATDRGHIEEIITHLKKVETDYHINLTSEKEWLRGLAKDEPASEELEKVVEEIVDPTVLNAYGVKEIANRLRRTMIESVSEEQVKELLISKHEDKTCKENDDSLTQKSASDDLWEASKQYALRQVFASTDEEMSEQAYLDLRLFSGLELAVAHKDGAQWQKKKDDYAIEIAHMAGEEEGKNLLKQQMLQNAITATCFGFQGAALFSFRLPSDNYLVGSERKIVLIKDE